MPSSAYPNGRLIHWACLGHPLIVGEDLPLGLPLGLGRCDGCQDASDHPTDVGGQVNVAGSGGQTDPPVYGTRVSTPEGEGRVVGHSVPRDAVVVRMDADGSRCSCSRASVCGPRKAHDERYV